ncbi:MAG: rod shape-determining protein MreD [Thermomicrobiales bacterium]|nr:rod shape-determining protein MreD [Thermomicrobiales bacterium]
MARILFALCLVGAALIQATILPNLDLIEVLPDLTLVLLLVWSALRGTAEGLVWAFGLGLFIDMLALDPLGVNGLALLGVALLGGISQRRFFHSRLVLPLALAVVATVIHALVLLLFRTGEGAGLPVSSVFRLIVLQALLNSMCVPPLYVIAGWMERRMDTRRGWT